MAPPVVLTVRELRLHGEAAPADLGATQIHALRWIHLIRLAARVAELIRRRALAIRITVVLLQRRAMQVDAERSASLVVVHHLALVLRFLRPLADASLDLVFVTLTLGGLTLRRGAPTTLGGTPQILARRRVRLTRLAQLVTEDVLRRNRFGQGEGLDKPRSPEKETAFGRHPLLSPPFVLDSRARTTAARRTALEERREACRWTLLLSQGNPLRGPGPGDDPSARGVLCIPLRTGKVNSHRPGETRRPRARVAWRDRTHPA